MDLQHFAHHAKVTAGNALMAAPPAAAVFGADDMFGVPHKFWLFAAGLGILWLQGLYWCVQIWIKVKRERERVANGQPPETTDAAKL